MLSLAQYFSALAPNEYANADTKAAVEGLYAIAQEQVTASIWGQFTNKAVVLLSLHLWAVDIANTSTALTGALIAAETGESSKKQWSDPMGGRAITEDYETTKWGLQYLSLRKNASGSHLFVGMRRC